MHILLGRWMEFKQLPDLLKYEWWMEFLPTLHCESLPLYSKLVSTSHFESIHLDIDPLLYIPKNNKIRAIAEQWFTNDGCLWSCACSTGRRPAVMSVWTPSSSKWTSPLRTHHARRRGQTTNLTSTENHRRYDRDRHGRTYWAMMIPSVTVCWPLAPTVAIIDAGYGSEYFCLHL